MSINRLEIPNRLEMANTYTTITADITDIINIVWDVIPGYINIEKLRDSILYILAYKTDTQSLYLLMIPFSKIDLKDEIYRKFEPIVEKYKNKTLRNYAINMFNRGD